MRNYITPNTNLKEITLDDIKLQKIRLERARFDSIVQSAVFIFFIYLLVGLIGVMKDYFTVGEFFILLFMALFILFIAVDPYMRNIKQEILFLENINKRASNKLTARKKRK
jgi:hypothetical protein